MRRRKIGSDEDSVFEKLFFYFFLLVLIFWVLGYLVNTGKQETSAEKGAVYYGITVQVLNGCGVKGLSQTFAEMLRAGGFTVDNFGNASSMDYPETILLDRKGAPQKAELIAKYLNLPPSSVVLQRANDFVYTDFILIIGKDYRRYIKG